ncbi:MAG: glutamate-5-semialdehyde dehydrogenase [Clostridia bacterium]|nr:glutamate-5-semialdehyde dehydrogenase [Clostridia bacterium]
MEDRLLRLFSDARAAAKLTAAASDTEKRDALLAMADALCDEKNRRTILEANARDVERARGKLSPSMIDRLSLDGRRLDGMAEGIREAAALPDPVGLLLDSTVRPNGLRIDKVSVPIGVIGIIYESRPNVTSDAAALCLRSGNACLLKPGSDATESCAAIVSALRSALLPFGLSDAVGILDGGRSDAAALMEATGYVDLLIPRGGAKLIRACVENAKIPVIQTGTGICHIYVDGAADPEMALDIIDNAKTSRPSVCNACEVCLVSREIADTFLPLLKKRLVDERAAKGLVPVELRLDAEASGIIPGTPAGEKDFDTEFLDYILAVGIVDGVKTAVEHIAEHSTGHSEAIVTSDERAADYFLRSVDSAAVYHNASTRFTDGGEFGLGCEIGISTQKMHARGPMGLRELTSYKYTVRGNGQTR